VAKAALPGTAKGKPLIGVSSYFVADSELEGHRLRGTRGQDMLMSNLDYARSISEAGGVPVALPVLEDLQAASDLVDHLDGLLLAGGEDVDPCHYRQDALPDLGRVSRQRDRYEWALLDAALAKGIAIFGVCRGLQLLNVYFGGTLHQDLASRYSDEVPHASAHLGREALVHEVHFPDKSFLLKCFGKETIWVNSLHHQGADRLGVDLTVAALSPDGLVEAVQHRTRENLFAVQWHPEMMTGKYPLQRRLFHFFIAQSSTQPAGVSTDQPKRCSPLPAPFLSV
jgi:putative glutamine amidotransferase